MTQYQFVKRVGLVARAAIVVGVIISPIVVPLIVLALANYLFFVQLRFIAAWIKIGLAHSLLVTPYVFVTVQASLAYDRSSYDDPENGSEDRTELALAVSRTLSGQWRAFLRYAYADNQAELPDFDYQRNLVSAGVEASW